MRYQCKVSINLAVQRLRYLVMEYATGLAMDLCVAVQGRRAQVTGNLVLIGVRNI